MRGRGLILGIIVLVLLGFLVAKELRQDKREGKLQKTAVVFEHSSYMVSEFTLKLHGEADSIEGTFRRVTDGWEVVSCSRECDLTYAPDVLSAWSRVRFLDVVDEQPREEDLKRYGLVPGVAELKAVLKPEAWDGKGVEPVPPQLIIGQPAPRQLRLAAYYGRLDGFERVVYLTPDALDIVQGSGRQLLGLRPVEFEAPAE